MYNEAAIRSRILSDMQAVANVGAVYDYERWAHIWDELLALYQVTINGTPQLRGWTITLVGWNERVIGFQGGGTPGTTLVTYEYRIRGFMAMNDDTASEKEFLALGLAVADALKADAVLAGDVFERDTPFVEKGLTSYKMFAGVLCNCVEMTVRPQEIV